MPDMENFHAFVSFHDSVYYAIDVRLVAIKQMPEIRIFAGRGASAGMFAQSEDRRLETEVPFQSGFRFLGVDFVVRKRKVALRARS
jgi:hypothetical protein